MHSPIANGRSQPTVTAWRDGTPEIYSHEKQSGPPKEAFRLKI